MKHLSRSALLVGALVLAGCVTTLTPKDYGFEVVTIGGQQQYCAPREWVVPHVVPAEAADDPFYQYYQQFVKLPETTVTVEGHYPMRAVCITEAQWPQWLTIRQLWNENWAVTPATADSLAAVRH